MKTFLAILCVTLGALGIRAADAPAAEVKLTGIAHVGGRAVALLDLKPARGPVQKPILSVNEKAMDVELLAIDAKAGKVSLNVNGAKTEASLGAPGGDEAPALHFKDAASSQVLAIYQELSGRTVLSSPSLPVAAVTLKTASSLSREASLDALSAALREQGIIVTPRADKFTFATLISHVPRLAQIPDPPAPSKNDQGAKEETFPPGLFKFQEVDKAQLLDIYQELSGRTLLISPELPAAKFTFKTQTRLTRGEALWAFDAVLYLATIKVIPEGPRLAFVLPATRNVAAPKIPDNPLSAKLKESKDGVAAGFIKLQGAPPGVALVVYSQLIGREPLIEPTMPVTRLWLKNQSALHPVEALYALDALAHLHNLRFVLVGDNQVKIVHASDAGKTAGKN